MHEDVLRSIIIDVLGRCSSDVRCLRYVGTLTASHIASDLVRVIAGLVEERDIADRQHAVETGRKGGKVTRFASMKHSIKFPALDSLSMRIQPRNIDRE